MTRGMLAVLGALILGGCSEAYGRTGDPDIIVRDAGAPSSGRDASSLADGGVWCWWYTAQDACDLFCVATLGHACSGESAIVCCRDDAHPKPGPDGGHE